MRLSLVFSLLVPAIGFAPKNVPRAVSSVALWSSNDRSFYDILGASPNDTEQQIRFKYRNLTRGSPQNAAEIDAAWSILQDPEKRKLYDQGRMKGGDTYIREDVAVTPDVVTNDIPNGDAFVVDPEELVESAMQQVQQQLKRAINVFDLEIKSRQMEERAKREMARAKQVMNKLELDRLVEIPPDLTSLDAKRIMKGFKLNITNLQAIQDLELNEDVYRDKKRYLSSLERETRLAQTKFEQAVARELKAIQNLQDAQRELSDAQKDAKDCRTLQEYCVGREQETAAELEKASQILREQQEVVRTALRQTEEEKLKIQDEELKEQSMRAREAAQALLDKAEKLREEAREARQVRLPARLALGPSSGDQSNQYSWMN